MLAITITQVPPTADIFSSLPLTHFTRHVNIQQMIWVILATLLELSSSNVGSILTAGGVHHLPLTVALLQVFWFPPTFGRRTG